jgi:hypothetical protein
VTLFAIRVEQEAASALVERLNDRWLEYETGAVYNADYDFHFVPVTQRYHLFRNCNPVLAGWLRDLDCQVRGPALLSNWRLRPVDLRDGSGCQGIRMDGGEIPHLSGAQDSGQPIEVDPMNVDAM